MTEPRSDDRSQARREAATLLGVDIDRMSAADGLRVDMISALRLVIDHEQATVLSGSSGDLAKLNVAVSSLIALLPGRELPAPEQRDDHDDREAMIAPLRKLYRYLHEQVHTLTAENAQLRAALGLKGFPNSGETAIDPAEADITPPGEYRGVPPMRGPDDPPAKSTRVIEGKANPPAASAAPPANRTPTFDSTPNGRAWNEWRNAGGYSAPGFDRWANRNE